MTTADPQAGERAPSELRRLAIAGVGLALVVAVPASVALVAAFGWDVEALLSTGSDLRAIVAGGHSAAVLLHWGALGDMLYSYVLLVPLALYLHSRFRERGPWLADLGTVAAFAYIFVGGAGAAILAFGGPSLIDAYASALAPERVPILASFSELRDIVVFGLWQTLDPITLGVWILSVGWLIRPERRATGVLLVVLGLGTASVSALTALGTPGLAKVALGWGLPVLGWALWFIAARATGRERTPGSARR